MNIDLMNGGKTLGKVCFHCGKEITTNDQYQMEPIEGAYPYRYGNLFFHKELCYRTIKNIPQYLIDNAEKVFDVLANGTKNIPEKKEKIPVEENIITKKNEIKKEKQTKPKKVKRK